MLSDKESERLAQKWLNEKLKEDEKYRDKYGPPDQELRHRQKQREAEIEQRHLDNPHDCDPVLSEGPYARELDFFHDFLERRQEDELVLQDIEDAFENEIYSSKVFKEGTIAYHSLVHHFTVAKLDYYHTLNERASGNVESALPPLQNGVSYPSLPGTGLQIHTLSILMERWKKERKPKPGTIEEWELAIRHFVALNGELDIRQIQKAHVLAFKDWLVDQDRKATTGNKKLAALHSLFEYAIQNELLEVS